MDILISTTNLSLESDCKYTRKPHSSTLSRMDKERHLRYVDYFTLLAGKDGKILPAYSKETEKVILH